MVVDQCDRPLVPVTSVEMFSDAKICDGADCCVIQVIQRWWVYDDGSYAVATHRADDPMQGYSVTDDDPQRYSYIVERTAAMRSLTRQLA